MGEEKFKSTQTKKQLRQGCYNNYDKVATTINQQLKNFLKNDASSKAIMTQKHPKSKADMLATTMHHRITHNHPQTTKQNHISPNKSNQSIKLMSHKFEKSKINYPHAKCGQTTSIYIFYFMHT